MMNFPTEMIEKAKAAKTAEELLEIAKAEGVEMTAEEANEYYQQLTSCELDDDLLGGVAGGYAQEAPIDDDAQSGHIAESPFTTVSTARPAKTGCK